MKIFAAGIATETNTFCPIPTTLDDFAVQRGRDVLLGRISYPTLDLTKPWGEQAKECGEEFVFSLMAWAKPGGTTVRSAYEELRDEVLIDLRAAIPVDIVLLMLHGAMIAEGYESCEKDLIERVRDVVGPSAVIGVELDLHCHLSLDILAAADVVITFKEYPHIDVQERASELFSLCHATRTGRIRPVMAIFDCHMIGLYPTTRSPMREFVKAMSEAEHRQGMLSVSLGHGFPFADVRHAGAKVLTIADGDRALAESVARELGMKVYALRREIGFESLALSMDDAFAKAFAVPERPVIVADQSDNTGGGAPGDATFALRWLLDHRATEIALAILYDPEVVRIAKKAGQGAILPVRLGGKMGPASGDPIDIEVEVLSIRDDYMHAFPQRSGEVALYPAGDVVALRHGSVDIVVGTKRCQCFDPSIFTDLGVDPKTKRLVVVKSAQHFYSGFASIAQHVIYMAGPGAVAPDPKQIPYRQLDTSKKYPWVADPLRVADQ
jgi:microcystin degradation protein MlrC